MLFTPTGWNQILTKRELCSCKDTYWQQFNWKKRKLGGTLHWRKKLWDLQMCSQMPAWLAGTWRQQQAGDGVHWLIWNLLQRSQEENYWEVTKTHRQARKTPTGAWAMNIGSAFGRKNMAMRLWKDLIWLFILGHRCQALLLFLQHCPVIS